ncbi:MAG: ATP-binding protein [Thermoanaerobaculia bacterium]|nr:ATP-binding protein [Thermoanaerobaculia bacterium]
MIGSGMRAGSSAAERRCTEEIIREEIEHDGDLRGLRKVVAFVEDQCRQNGVSAEDRTALRLATEEVFVNILEHGYEAGSGSVKIEVQRDEDRLRVTFRDRGRPFRPGDAPSPDLDSDWSDRRVGGLGWHLVRSSVDEIDYRRDEGGWNVLRVTKEISRDNGDDSDPIG